MIGSAEERTKSYSRTNDALESWLAYKPICATHGWQHATMNFAVMVADVFLEGDLADIAVLCDFDNPRDGADEGRCS